VLALVPNHGIYAAGGGLTSSAWRVVVDYDAKTIASGTTAQHGAPSYGKLDHEATKQLADADRDRLARRGNDAWLEPPPRTPHLRSPTTTSS